MADSTETLDPGDPPSSLDDAALFQRLKRQFMKDRDANDEWRREAKTDYAFEAGYWLSDEDQDILKMKGLPDTGFNRIGPTVRTITGMEVGNRQEAAYLPRTKGDEGLAETCTEAARYVRDQCDAEDEESDAFHDTVTVGVGCTETAPEYDTDPDGAICVNRVDPLEMVWDGSAKKRNLDDARRVFRVKEMELETAQEMFPDADPGDLHASWASSTEDEDSDPVDREAARWYRGDSAKQKQGAMVRIVQAQWKEYEKVYRVLDPTTQVATTLSAADWAKVSKTAKKAGIKIKSVPQRKCVYKQAFLGNELLRGKGPDGKAESMDCPCEIGFTFKFITGYRDHKKNMFYGIVRPMRGPQAWANTFFNSILQQIRTTGRGLMAERGAFDNDIAAENDLARSDKILWLKTGAIAGQKVQPKPQGQVPAGTDRMMEFALTSMRDVSGVNTETLGSANRDQAASLEYQRRQSATTMLATLFDNLRRYRKEQGRIMLWEINEYISDGRLIRIVGDQDAQFVPLMKMPDNIKFDIVVDESPSSPNQKEAAWAALQPIIQMIPNVAPAGLPTQTWENMLKLSPIPESAVNDIFDPIKQQEAQRAAQPPQPSPEEIQAQAQAQQTQADMQMKQMDVGVKQQDSQVKLRELAVKEQELQVRVAELEMNAQSTRDAQTHEQSMKRLEIGGATDQAMVAGDLPGQMGSIAQSIQALAMSIAQSAQASTQELKVTTQGIQALIQTLQMPKQVTWSADGRPIGIEPAQGGMLQ